jgi:hypothetical protein
METFEKMQALLEQIKPDVQKVFDKGNGSAGTRVRQSMQELKNLAQQLRTEIQEVKKQKS